MKHSLKIILILVLFFLAAQLIGLRIVHNYIDVPQTIATGEVQWAPLPPLVGMQLERPTVEPRISLVFIISAILIGTLLILALIRFRRIAWWKLWFFLAVVLCLHVALGAFVQARIAFPLALVLGWLKAFRPNILVHNGTELLIYGGLAAIFVPILNVFTTLVLLFLISGYDMYAVWKTKHMVKMAKFQAKSGIFAGLLIPYKTPKKPKKKPAKKPIKKIRVAMLGGGDVGFPLIFAGVVLKELGITHAVIVSLLTSAALFLLLYFGQQKKFYPAMPFLTAGCLVGYGIALLL